MSTQGQLDRAAGPLNARILDISEGGFSAELAHPLAVGSRVELTCPGADAAGARVVWQNGLEHGFQFERPLDTPPPRTDRQTQGVIWVDFKSGALLDGPVEPNFSQRYSGVTRAALALSLGMAAWAAIGAIGWMIYRLVG